MILIIQALLIIAAVAVIFIVLGRRSSHSGKAWKKIGLVFLGLAMIITVIFPELTNKVANFLGVGRGADLLLYALAVAFIFYALNSYLHQQDQRDKIYRLARRVAIIEANNKNKNRLK